MMPLLVVTDLHGNKEPAVDYKNLEINEEVNGDFSLSCVFLNTDRNQYAWPLVAEESIIEYEGHQFRIKKSVKERLRNTVIAPHIFFDLIDHYVYGINGGTKTPGDAFSFVLEGTGWTFEIEDDIPATLLPNFGEANAVSLIRTACTAFGCEIKLMPNKHLRIYKQIGKDEDYQFRYKHNIKAIKETVDTTKLATVIKGFGSNGLEVTYTSPNIAVFGERHAEPIRDDRYTIAESLIEQCKQELVDYPEVSIELEALLLEGAELGDTVWLIHEPLGIEFQTRIMAQKRQPRTLKADAVTLGNRKASLSDLLTETKVEINENKKETRSKIEQTNERITMEVERVDESIATLKVEADEVKLSVEAVEQSVAAVNVRADNIVLSVQSLDDRLGQAESSISVQAGQISSKVSQTDYNGNTIASLINQTAGAVLIDAPKINLLGITNVSNSLNIGLSNEYSTTKSISFRGAFGGVSSASIYSPANTDSVVISCMGSIDLIGNVLDLTNVARVEWGNNAPVARFG